MKLRSFVIYLLFICYSLALNGQSIDTLSPCGTAPQKDAWLTHYQLNKVDYAMDADSLLLVPLSIHLLGTDEGQGYYSTKRLMAAVCQLNDDFAPSQIWFYIEGDIHYISKSEWNDHPDVIVGAQMMFANNIEGTINCYIVMNPARNCGYNLPYAGIALSKSCIGRGNHTWAHEMGHNLSLPHPFLGWEGHNYNYNDTTPRRLTYDYTLFKDSLILDTTIIDTAWVETVERTNCDIAADGFCDTQPDYISRRWNCNQDGESTGKFKDFNEVDFKVDGSLFMSYSNDACQNRFSPDQMDAMRATLMFKKPELITHPDLPDALDLTYRLNYPIEDEVVAFDLTELNWDEIEGANKYYIEVSRSPRFSRIIYSGTTSSPFVEINSLSKNKKYYWRIYAYGPYFYCSESSEVASFRTSDVSSTLNQIKGIRNVSLKWTDQGLLDININLKDPINLALDLYNVSGQLLYNKEFEQNSTEFHESISVSSNWPAGSYVIILRSENGQNNPYFTVKYH